MRKVRDALLIDDDNTFRATLQGALRRRGVRAVTAATVSEGLADVEDRIEAEPLDLVVVDYRMPHVDGLSALHRLRSLAPDAAIIMLTGFGDIQLAVEAVRRGADTLLTKPVDADRLLREADMLLQRPRGVAHLPSPASSLNLDELEREAIRAALKQSGGVVATAAKLLGIDRRTLQRKLRRQTDGA